MSEQIKYVEVVLDKPRKLLLDMNAMASFEEQTGKNFFEFSSGLVKERISAKDLRAFLWCALVHEDSGLTVEQVGSMIRADNMVEVQRRLAEAQSVNLPESKGTRPLE